MADPIQQVVNALEHSGAVAPEVPPQEPPVKVAETGSLEAEVTLEEPQMTYQSILSDMLVKLEGAIHMSKPEILALIDEARSLVQQL